MAPLRQLLRASMTRPGQPFLSSILSQGFDGDLFVFRDPPAYLHMDIMEQPVKEFGHYYFVDFPVVSA